jgi:hypothetical protein
MARLTPESILGEIWYESRALHLISAPICVFVDSVELGQPSSNQQIILDNIEYSTTLPKREGLNFFRPKLAYQALGGYSQGLVPLVPHLLDSKIRNRGAHHESAHSS